VIACESAQESLDATDHDFLQRGDEPGMLHQHDANRPWKRQRPLPIARARHHIVNKMRGDIGHATTRARWAQRTTFARECDTRRFRGASQQIPPPVIQCEQREDRAGGSSALAWLCPNRPAFGRKRPSPATQKCRDRCQSRHDSRKLIRA
jgi:hypothetical protein